MQGKHPSHLLLFWMTRKVRQTPLAMLSSAVLPCREKIMRNPIIYFWMNRKERQTTLAMPLSTVLTYKGRNMLQANHLLWDK
jgi:hypothetical protein